MRQLKLASTYRQRSRKRRRKHAQRIGDMAATLMAELTERGDELCNPTAADVLYTSRYLITKSVLAPFYQGMGITNPSTLGRSFYVDHSPNKVQYCKYVYWLYALHHEEPDILRVEGSLSKLFSAHQVAHYSRLIARLFYMMLRARRIRVRASMGQAGDKQDLGLSAVHPIEDTNATYKQLKDMYRVSTSDAGLAIAAAMEGLDGDSEAKLDTKRYADMYPMDLARSGSTRKSLVHLTDVTLPTEQDPVAKLPTELAENDKVEDLLGVSHMTANLFATEYQDTEERRIHLMYNWELLEGTPYFDNQKQENEEQVEDYEDETLLTAGSLTSASVPKEVMRLAEKLAKKHGPVTISNESSGLHINIPDPELLRTDGAKELASKHVAINAEMYLGIGTYDVDKYPTKENRHLYNKYRKHGKEVPCASSMKTRKVYMVSDLLAYVPISKRSDLFANVKANVITGAVRKRLVCDENGNLVPEWCGHTIPLHELPSNHPAVEYLTSRGYNLALLETQFECCYCDEALPESRGEGRYYSRLPGGMVNSPQGRIIFVVRMNGVRVGYQSRYIDKWADDKYYFWSPEQRWVLIKTRNADGTETLTYPPTQQFPKGFDPHKYLNATGSERNKLLMGFDAAVASQNNRPFEHRYCVLVEGPLDAARIGAPALAILGKSLSPYQAEAIRKNFARVVTVMDNDEAGRQCLSRIYRQLPNTPIREITIPDTVKDIGELSYKAAYELVTPYDPLRT